MSAQWRLILLLRQPLRAPADEWEGGRRMGILALRDFTPHAVLTPITTSPVRTKRSPRHPGAELEEKDFSGNEKGRQWCRPLASHLQLD
jgi:hypothetical protein